MQQGHCHTLVPIGFETNWILVKQSLLTLQPCSLMTLECFFFLLVPSVAYSVTNHFLASIQGLWCSHLATSVQWMLAGDCSQMPRDSVLTNVSPPVNVSLCFQLLQCSGCAVSRDSLSMVEKILQCAKSKVDACFLTVVLSDISYWVLRNCLSNSSDLYFWDAGRTKW